MKKPKEQAYVPVTLSLDEDVYFGLLEICLRERKTLDQLVNEILSDYVKKNKGVKK